MKDLISVIIPVFNVQEYVTECLESVVCQTYTELEIIIINDGSTDNSLSICENYAKKDNRIRIISQSNSGLSAARNTGINHANGTYLTFVDSDDVIEPDMIKYLYDLIQEADLSVCQRINIDENSIPFSNKSCRKKQRVIEGNVKCMKEFFIKPDIDTVAWGKLYRKKMFNNIRYPVGRYHEDVFTTYKIIAQCEKIAVGNKEKYFYRKRGNSITNHGFSIQHLDGVYGNIERVDFIGKYYPSLLKYAEAGIIYSANQCALKMFQGENCLSIIERNTKQINFLQKLYRQYEASFLIGKSSMISKIFSLFAWINLRWSIKILSWFYNMKNRLFNPHSG